MNHSANSTRINVDIYTFNFPAQLIVEFEFERTVDNWKPRRFGGGLGGKKESGQLRFGGRNRRFQRPFKCNWQSK